jgi:hypothetical protein
MMKDNFVQMLTGNRQIDRSDAVSYIMRDPNFVARAKQFYGEASPEWDAIRKEAMLSLLKQTVKPGDEILSKTLTHGGLSSIIKATNPRVLDELFGEDVAHNLRELAKQVDFMTGKPKGASTAAFAAASLILHPVAHIGTLGSLAVSTNLMRSAPFLRWLVLGLKGDRKAFSMAQAAARTAGYMLEPTTPLGKGTAGATEAIMGTMGESLRQDIGSGVESDPLINLMRGRGFTAGQQQ